MKSFAEFLEGKYSSDLGMAADYSLDDNSPAKLLEVIADHAGKLLNRLRMNRRGSEHMATLEFFNFTDRLLEKLYHFGGDYEAWGYIRNKLREMQQWQKRYRLTLPGNQLGYGDLIYVYMDINQLFTDAIKFLSNVRSEVRKFPKIK